MTTNSMAHPTTREGQSPIHNRTQPVSKPFSDRLVLRTHGPSIFLLDIQQPVIPNLQSASLCLMLSNITELKLSLTLCTVLTLEIILDPLTKPALTAPGEQGQK